MRSLTPYRAGFLLFAALFLSSCQSSSSLLGSWTRDAVSPKSYYRLAIVAFSPNMGNRATVEEQVEAQFRKEGINALGTFDIFPLAGQPEIFEGVPEAEVQQAVKEKMEKFRIEGLLTITLFDAQQEERYVEGPSFTVSAPMYAYPAYSMPYYQYFTYATATVSNPGYYQTTSTYFLEFNLYDVASEELIWTAQTSSKDPSSVAAEAEKLGKLVVRDLLKKNVFEKK